MKDIPGFEGWYAADALGNIYSLAHIRVICPRGKKIQAHYPLKKMRCTISRSGDRASVLLVRGIKRAKRMFVHRLIAMTFLGLKSIKHRVIHIDGNQKNNKVDNLKIVIKL